MKHIMLDIETLGNGSDAVVASIGAVIFDPFELDTYDSIISNPGRCFSRHLNMDTQVKKGLTMDPETVKWWFRQSEYSRKFISDANPNPHIQQDLTDFSDFCQGATGLWGNGATFDNVIIRNLFKACGVPFPISFWQDKCYRTVKNLIPMDKQPEFIRYGVHHSAVDDAITQAIHLQKMFQVLRFE